LVSGLVFLTTFFAGAFTGAFATGLFIGLIIGLATTLLIGFVVFFLRYLESSNARIGMKIIFTNKIPSPNVRCFQNLSVILNTLIIIIIRNNGGKNIDSVRRHDIPPSLNINTRL
jgi:hypothetical protein